MGDGDHGWAAAEFVSLLREMLVRETPEGLELLSGVPRGWLDAPAGIRLGHATTRFGTLRFSVGSGNGGVVLEWALDRAPHQDSGNLAVSVPDRDGRRTIKILPSPSGRIRLDDDGRTSSENP